MKAAPSQLTGRTGSVTLVRGPERCETSMNDEIEILRLTNTSSDILRFLKVSYGIYRDDPHWVAPLLTDLKKVFTRENPLFEHARMQLWVARKAGQDVGRIAGIVDDSFNTPARQPTAFFGFFESTNDAAVSHGLFETIRGWAHQQGLKNLQGPMNPTTNDECGLLVEGFDSAPVFMMTYNPRYYVALLEKEGFKKAKDLLAFHIDLAILPMDRLSRIAAKVRKRNPELTFRPILRKTLEHDIVKLKEVYNAAWKENWGFVPMTNAEVDFMAKRLKPLLMEGLVWLTEAGNEPVGFLLALPDYNTALQPLRGYLMTPKLFGFVPYLMGWKRPKRTRVLTLGVKDEYRGRGLESAMLIEGLKVGFDAGVRESEASWILEDNLMMCRVLEAIGGRIYKRYRIYERDV
jgi:ribosomal protein S18 acetylase RimI-like enzyme